MVVNYHDRYKLLPPTPCIPPDDLRLFRRDLSGLPEGGLYRGGRGQARGTAVPHQAAGRKGAVQNRLSGKRAVSGRRQLYGSRSPRRTDRHGRETGGRRVV